KPAKDFASFARGYADTNAVELRTGGVAEEGAARQHILRGARCHKSNVHYGRPAAFCRLLHAAASQRTDSGTAIRSDPYRERRVEAGVGRPRRGVAGEMWGRARAFERGCRTGSSKEGLRCNSSRRVRKRDA